LLRVKRIRRSGLLRQQHDVHYERVVELIMGVVGLPLNAGQYSLSMLDCLKGYLCEIIIVEGR